jgi:coenzyme F420-0:L-glutamate ligase/coenzyme F420-1:gamma-L-glutamate ligase
MLPLTLTPLTGIPFIRHGDDLADILINALEKSNIILEDNDILVLAQKIVSKAEGRFVNLETITPHRRARQLAVQTEKDPRLIELIQRESNGVLRIRPGVIIVEHKLGFICANAGIDHSNVGSHSNDYDKSKDATEDATTNSPDWVLLLPENPSKSAQDIRKKLEGMTGKKIGVMIIDSHGRTWRIGTVGICIGLSGLPAIIDERGWKDLFGDTLKVTVVGAADELSAAASLVMGQAAEGIPAVHVRGFPYPLREGSLKELIRPKKQDLFR